MSIYDQFTEQELALLRARAERVAGATGEDQDSDTITALLVTLRDEIYALPVMSIIDVSDESIIVPVPCVPPFVAGIANMRGHIIPVLDLAELLRIPGDTPSERHVLVRAANEEMAVAFRVEAVGEIVTLALDEMDPIPDIMDIVKMDYLQGAFPNGIVMLDIAAILGDEALQVEGEVS